MTKVRCFLSLILMLSLAACNIAKKTSNGDSSSLNSGSSAGPGGQTPDLSGFKLTCEEARFVALLNLYRVSQGLSALRVSEAGVRSTRWHAQDMIDKNYFSHTEPNGRGFSTRASDFGYGAWAENIAAGNFSADGTFCQWRNSPGHNSNMLGSHQSLGIGRATGGGTYGTYWSNNFGPLSQDLLSEPLTIESGCQIPTAVPGC